MSDRNWADYGDPASGDWTGYQPEHRRPPVLDRGRWLFITAGVVAILAVTAAIAVWLMNR